MTLTKLSSALALSMALVAAGPTQAAPTASRATTIILVHGAFAGSSSWNPVISALQRDGYHVIAAANPLRSVAGDGDYVARLVKSVPGPVVLVGHSYGGQVITVAAASASNV